jgi:dipeptidyl aminopeptidase/acylaminoacyl peptidase
MRAELLRAARAWIDPAVMRPKRAVELAARDGLKLHGYVTEPLGKGPFPMVVIPHDGAMGDTRFFDPIAQLLASRGYAVLQVNYRGSSGYGRQFAAAGNGEWGARMQDDVTDATRWAISQGLALEGRACILGQGYGGYAALTGVVRETKLYRCAIGVGGYYDLELLAADSDLSFAERRFVQQGLGSDPEVLRARSPVHNAQRIEVPVLMIHGDQDSVAGYEHAQKMRLALRKHGKPVDLMTLKGENHDLYDEQTRRQVYERVVGFLATQLRQ